MAGASALSVKAARGAPEKLADALIRPAVYWMFHSWRLFGYFLAIPPLLAFQPRRTLAGLLAYGAVHRQQWWQKLVHRLCGYAASKRHRIVNDVQHLIDSEKRYLWALHPHSILADGWHSLIARNLGSFADEGLGPPGIGRKISLCFAPIVQHVPIHQEMYRDKCGAADKAAIERWWDTPDIDPALIPGGFAESVFSNASETNVEYSYIKDRKGFVRIAIANGKDIVPVYTFRATRMYYNPPYLRGLRARLSQRFYIGLALWLGKLGTSMPLTDKTTTVVFPPFPASQYDVGRLDEAHAAYLQHLKSHFDANKDKYGMKGVELMFIGHDFQDDDVVARALRRIGIISRQVK